MSMFSMTSSNCTPGLRIVSTNGYRLTQTRSIIGILCSATCRVCSGFSRMASSPAAIRGLIVLTRPSRISGKPVRSEYFANGNAIRCKKLVRSSGRNDFDIQSGQAPGKFHNAGLVVHTDQRALNSSHSGTPIEGRHEIPSRYETRHSPRRLRHGKKQLRQFRNSVKFRQYCFDLAVRKTGSDGDSAVHVPAMRSRRNPARSPARIRSW